MNLINTFVLIVTAAFLLDAMHQSYKATTAARRHADYSMFTSIVAEMIMGVSGVCVLFMSA